MKLLVCAVLGIAFLSGEVRAEEATLLKSRQDKMSYGLGVDIARNLKKQEVQVNPDILMRGLRDELSGAKLQVDEKELKILMSETQNEMRKKAVLNRRLASGDNMKKGADFLAANRGKPGVQTLPSGVQYKVLKAGDGRKPSDADSVECYYRGTLIDGTEFESTQPGKPATLKLRKLIPGWREALQQMPVGSTWQIVIPPQLAYGERGSGSSIGPNEALLFEVELLSVK